MAEAGRETSISETFLDQPPARDRRIAALAGRQHGVLSLAQLRELGLSASAVRTRAAMGRLHRVHHRVYAVGHTRLTREGRWMAAVLACGPSSLLSHRSAAAALDLRSTSRTAIEVVVAARGGRALPGIEVHRSSTLVAADATTVTGIPCTTVARTLVDLADVIDRRGLERACDRAEVLQILDARALQEALERAKGRRGAPVLRSILESHAVAESLTRSELEERFLALCARAGLPRPLVNQSLTLDAEAIEADFIWPDRRLVVETDGYATHRTAAAFELDRWRDQHLTLAGWRPVRFTWRQVVHRPREVAATLRRLLAA